MTRYDEMTSNLTMLLKQVNQISRKYDDIYKNTGKCFNIFSIADLETNEVVICRILKELIDSKGVHYQGNVYLKLFLEHVLGLSGFDDVDLNNSVVEREKLIENNRRIDLFIKIPKKIEIPIEVKIYAGDQYAQCRDYYKYAINSKLYYLTLDGHMPSEDSLLDLNVENVKIISFKKEIIGWLLECLKLPETIQLAPIREIILQFIDMLRKLTNQSEDRMEREIVNLILESKENYKNAEMIQNVLKEAETIMYDRYFKALHKRIIDKYPNFDYEEDDTEEVYDKSGIYYKIKQIQNNVNLDLYISGGTWIWTGLFLGDNDGIEIKYEKFIDKEDVIIGNWEFDGEWIAWKYVKSEINERPNFKYHNDAYYELLDSKELDRFVDETMLVIDELMNSLII